MVNVPVSNFEMSDAIFWLQNELMKLKFRMKALFLMLWVPPFKSLVFYEFQNARKWVQKCQKIFTIQIQKMTNIIFEILYSEISEKKNFENSKKSSKSAFPIEPVPEHFLTFFAPSRHLNCFAQFYLPVDCADPVNKIFAVQVVSLRFSFLEIVVDEFLKAGHS